MRYQAGGRQVHRETNGCRMGEAHDIANATVFLASESGKYITATEIVVDVVKVGLGADGMLGAGASESDCTVT